MASEWIYSERLTICRLKGDISFQELKEMKEHFFRICSPDMIVDLSEASLSGIPTKIVRSILDQALQLYPDCPEKRAKAKGISIWIGGNDLEYGLGRVVEVYAEMMQYHVPIYAVRTREEAIKILSALEKEES